VASLTETLGLGGTPTPGLLAAKRATLLASRVTQYGSSVAATSTVIGLPGATTTRRRPTRTVLVPTTAYRSRVSPAPTPGATLTVTGTCTASELVRSSRGISGWAATPGAGR